MMKRTKIKKYSKKKLIITAILILVILAAAGTFLFLRHKHNEDIRRLSAKPQGQKIENKVNYDPPTDQEKQDQAAQKDDIINKMDNPPVATDLTVAIIRAGQNGQGTPLNIRTIVDGATTGTCTVTFSKDGQANIVKSFPITFEATTSSCSGADVAAADFPAEGTWKMSITAQANNKTSAAATKDITIDK
jgi:hypothetical protein